MAQADFKRDYQEAVDAIDDGDFAKAREKLEEAIAEEPTSQARVRTYGMRFVPYLPHYYLGEALYQLGDCEAALAAWDEALAQGVVQGLDEVTTLQQNRQACEAQVVDVSAIAMDARSALEALGESIADLSALEDEDLLRGEWSADSPWQTTLSRATAELATLRTDLDAAEAARDAETIEQVDREATQLRDDVQAATGAASQRLAALRSQRERELANAADRARRELLAAATAARQAVNENAPDAASRQARNELAALVAQSDQLGANASTQRLNQLSRSLNGKVREFRTAVQTFENQRRAIARRTPPPALKQLAEAYFSGEYASAVRLADSASFNDERERIQALLFRAASRFHQYELGGREANNELEQVQADIRSIKALDRNFSPFVAAFPPKFTELFDATL